MKKEIVLAVILSLIIGLIIGGLITSKNIKKNYELTPKDLFGNTLNHYGQQFKEVNYDWGLGRLNATYGYDGIGAIDVLCKEKLTDEVIGVDLTNTDCYVDRIVKTGDFDCDVYEGQAYDCFVPLNVVCTCWYPE